MDLQAKFAREMLKAMPEAQKKVLIKQLAEKLKAEFETQLKEIEEKTSGLFKTSFEVSEDCLITIKLIPAF